MSEGAHGNVFFWRKEKKREEDCWRLRLRLELLLRHFRVSSHFIESAVESLAKYSELFSNVIEKRALIIYYIHFEKTSRL